MEWSKYTWIGGALIASRLSFVHWLNWWNGRSPHSRTWLLDTRHHSRQRPKSIQNGSWENIAFLHMHYDNGSRCKAYLTHFWIRNRSSIGRCFPTLHHFSLTLNAPFGLSRSENKKSDALLLFFQSQGTWFTAKSALRRCKQLAEMRLDAQICGTWMHKMSKGHRIAETCTVYCMFICIRGSKKIYQVNISDYPKLSILILGQYISK